MTLFTDLLSDPYALRKYAVVLRAYDDRTSPTPGLISMYYSTSGLTSSPSDTPPNQYYEGRVKSALEFKSEIVQQDRIRGEATPSYGNIVLANGDPMEQGDISGDNTLDFMDELSWNGQTLDVWLGGQLADGTELELSDYGKIGTFVVEDIDVSLEAVNIKIRDPRRALQVPILVNKYLGTGNYEGGVNLEGKPKPLCFGRCRFVPPVYLGVIDGKYTFQVNDGEILDVDAVYSNGSALTRVDSAPSAGQYVVDRERGTFQLGGSTLETIITCDVYGAVDNRASPSTFLQYPGEISEYIASGIAGVTVDQDSVNSLDAEAPYTVGIYISSQRNCDQVISELVLSVSGYYGFNRQGEITVGRITYPGVSQQTFDSTSVLNVERIATVAPTKRIIIGYEKCWQTLNFQQMAFDIPEDVRSFALEPYRTKASTNNPDHVTQKFPLAEEERFDTLLANEADALAEADRLQALYGSRSKIYRVPVKTQPFQRNLGDTVTIQDNRLNLSSGQDCVIIGMDEMALMGEIVITVWVV